MSKVFDELKLDKPDLTPPKYEMKTQIEMMADIW